MEKLLGKPAIKPEHLPLTTDAATCLPCIPSDRDMAWKEFISIAVGQGDSK